MTDVLIRARRPGDGASAGKKCRRPLFGDRLLHPRAQLGDGREHAEKLGLQLDIPVRLLRELLSKATEAVRSRLSALAPSETKNEIQRVLAKISSEVGREATASRDLSNAQLAVLQMQKEGRLNEAALRVQAAQIVAAISLLSPAPIDLIASLMQSARSSGLLVPCKAAGLKWPAVTVILCNRFAHHTMSDAGIRAASRRRLGG